MSRAPESTRWIARAARSKLLLGGLVAVVLVVGLVARILECQEGLPYQHHRDEQAIAALSLNMVKTGDWNPHFFNYGTLPIYANALVDAAHYVWLCAQPVARVTAMPTLDDIQTHFDTGYKWSFSHPSFLLWNRFLTAVMGAGTLLLTWLLAREVAGGWVGLAAIVLLAGLGFHVESSTHIAPDMPAAFFVLLATLPSVIYLRDGRPRTLLLAFLACGLAAACKYNAGVVLAVPFGALAVAAWTRGPGHRGWLWVAGFAAPLVVFVTCMPYAVLDFSTFVKDLGRESFHYNVVGSTGHEVEPGWPAIVRQLVLFREHASLPVLLVALAGVLPLLRHGKGRLLFVFPVLAFLLTTRTKIDFHRNYVAIYPFLSIAFGCGLALAVRAVRQRAPAALASGAVALLVMGGMVHLSRAVNAGRDTWFTPETRTRAIDAVNRLAAERGWSLVAVSAELRVHEVDLSRLEVPHEIVRLRNFGASEGRFDAIVTAASFSAPANASEDDKERAARLNRLQPRGTLLLEIEGEPQVFGVTKNPGVRIVAR